MILALLTSCILGCKPFFFSKRACARSLQDKLLLIFQQAGGELVQHSTDIDQDLGRFISLEIEAVFSCFKTLL